MTTADLEGEDTYDPFEEFNRSAGMGIVENPYPLFAMVRSDHPMKREEIDDAMIVPEGSDIEFMPIDRTVGLFTAYSFEAVQTVLKDGENFSSAAYAEVMGPVMGHTILEMDEPEHHLYRGLVQQAFSRKAMEGWERDLVRGVVDEHIDVFIDRDSGTADLVREVTFPFPVVVIARLLGLPREDVPAFHRRAVTIISAGFEMERAAQASQELYDYFCAIIDERRVHPSDDVISVLAQAELEGVRLDNDEICAFLRLLLPAGAETTYRSSSNLLWGLLSNTDQLDALRADRSLMPQAIEEGLRWEAPLIGIMRTAARDTEVCGVPVPAGSTVAINIGSANHDETVWENPESFDIFRPQKQHLAFAWGPHMCLGLHLARMETRVLLTQLFDRLPNLRFDPDAEVSPITGAIFRAPRRCQSCGPKLTRPSGDQGAGMRIEDLVLVSVDDHVVEPPDLFEGRLPQNYAEVAPKLVRKDSGIDVWQFQGAELPNIGLNAVAGRPPEEYAMDPTSFDDMRSGCYDIHDRVKDMNANGLLGSMCFPSFPQFCGQLFARTALKDEPLAVALVQAYNDWHIESWCGAYPGRFIPLAIPMMWDVEKMAAEVRRVAEKGCFAVTFSENPVHLGHPSIHSGHWDPFFATCEELGTVVNVHIGSSSRMVITADDAPMDVLITLSPINIVQAAADFVWSESAKKFPKLKYALSEGGIGWIPYFRERIDYTYDRHRFWTGQDMGDRLPSQVLDEQVVCCWIDDPVGIEMRHKMNVDQICWECDYPHSDSSWPQSPEAFWKQMQAANVNDEETDKISHANAMRIYKYDPFSVLGGRENCTVGALRAQAEGWDVSIKSTGIKASATGAKDLLRISQGK